MTDPRIERRRRQRLERRRRRLLVVGAVTLAAVAAIAAAELAQAPAKDVHPATTVHRARHRRVVRVAFRPTHATLTARVPILMYHVIAPPPPGAPFPGLYVTADLFAQQMRALAHAGFRAVTLDQVRRGWAGRGPLPRHPIVISFDNGYRTQYTKALPVLRRLHWVGDENLQLSGLPPSEGGLTRGDVLGMKRAGWELDTQGWSHADLPQLDDVGLTREIVRAQRLMWRLYRVRPHWFCYPSGRYDATVIEAMRNAGFVGATTVVPGWASPGEDPYRLPRLRVLADTSPAALLAQIAAARFAGPPPPSY